MVTPIELSWSVDRGAGGVKRLGGGAYDPYQSNAAGYGAMRTGIRRGLDRLGVPFEVVPAPGFFERIQWLGQPEGKPERGTRWRRWCDATEFLQAPPDDPVTRPDVTRICITTPESWSWDGAGTRIGYTMWESSQMPTGMNAWGPFLDGADVVVVPCEHNARLVRQVVKRARVEVVPLGLDAADWPLLDRTRQPDQPFVFLLSGQISYRKGWMQAYDAFKRAFGDRSDVRLVIKTSGRSDLCAMLGRNQAYIRLRGGKGDLNPSPGKAGPRSVWAYTFDDPNVLVLRAFWSRAALLKLYARADAFLWPTLGEGWGLPPREAAATGLPVITPDHTGQYDAARWAWRVIPSSPDGKAAVFGPWGYCGQWHRLDVVAMADQMVEAVEQREEAHAWAREHARPAVIDRSWTDVAADMLAVACEPASEQREVKCA